MSADSFAARWLAAVAPHLPPRARAELNAGRTGSSALREALADIAMTRPVAVMPSRSELAQAVRAHAAAGR